MSDDVGWMVVWEGNVGCVELGLEGVRNVIFKMGPVDTGWIKQNEELKRLFFFPKSPQLHNACDLASKQR